MIQRTYPTDVVLFPAKCRGRHKHYCLMCHNTGWTHNPIYMDWYSRKEAARAWNHGRLELV